MGVGDPKEKKLENFAGSEKRGGEVNGNSSIVECK
jgi:hypothetical protein